MCWIQIWGVPVWHSWGKLVIQDGVQYGRRMRIIFYFRSYITYRNKIFVLIWVFGFIDFNETVINPTFSIIFRILKVIEESTVLCCSLTIITIHLHFLSWGVEAEWYIYTEYCWCWIIFSVVVVLKTLTNIYEWMVAQEEKPAHYFQVVIHCGLDLELKRCIS